MTRKEIQRRLDAGGDSRTVYFCGRPVELSSFDSRGTRLMLVRLPHSKGKGAVLSIPFGELKAERS